MDEQTKSKVSYYLNQALDELLDSCGDPDEAVDYLVDLIKDLEIPLESNNADKLKDWDEYMYYKRLEE